MREEFKDEGWRDFQQRYQGTFGWYEKADKKKLLVQLIEVDNKRCKFIDQEGGSFTALSDKGNCFEFLPVKKGLYRTRNNDVVSCKRIPARQYKRGIADTNTQLTYLVSSVPIEVGFDILEEMFNAPSLNDHEKKMLFFGNDVLVHNNTFALTTGKVFVYDHKIGTYDIAAGTITLTSNLFKQEIEDMCTSLGMQTIIKVEE